MKVLVLAHGVLGFGAPHFLLFNQYLNKLKYFSCVSAAINQNVLKVLEPHSYTIGTVQVRADKLAELILENTSLNDEVYIVAHSMGGLDARFLLKQNSAVRDRVVALVTIGTPHEGSRVADAIITAGPGENIPEKILKFLPSKAQGLLDLTTEACAKFNVTYVDQPGITYYAIAGNALAGNKFSSLLKLASRVGHIENVPSDGVVTVESAERKGWIILPRWPVDHLAQIGWHWDYLFNSSEHIERYLKLISHVTRISYEQLKKI